MQIEQGIIPKFFAWLISISLVGIAIMRIAEAFESSGRYFWTTYDITGSKLTPRRAQYNQGTRPNGFKVITGVQLWAQHFTYARPDIVKCTISPCLGEKENGLCYLEELLLFS